MSEVDDFIKKKELDNPFYHQKVFKTEDLKRAKASWKDRMRFMFIPTCVQISDCGVVHFKQNRHGEILILKIEELIL